MLLVVRFDIKTTSNRFTILKPYPTEIDYEQRN